MIARIEEIKNLPEEIRCLVAGQDYEVNDVGMSGSMVLMFEDMVLKIQQETEETKSERMILQWLEGKLPAPKILSYVNEEGKSYLLMSRVQGKMACDDEFMSNPKLLVSVLAQSLKTLWNVDITDCPALWDLDAMLETARETVEKGLVDMENTQPETFGENGFQSPQELLEWLIANRPAEELVLSHGDFCLPNIFIQDEKLAGYIDLGRAGAADKWKDIAICYRSLKNNFDGMYSEKKYPDFNPDILFDELGIEPDWDKINYYILLDELF